jgi:maltose-binding protein MalE
MTTQAMEDLFSVSLQAPAWSASYAKAAAVDPIVQGFGAVADVSDPAPNLVVMDQVWPILDQAELDILDGESPEESMKDAGAQIQGIVDSQ